MIDLDCLVGISIDPTKFPGEFCTICIESYEMTKSRRKSYIGLRFETVTENYVRF